MKVVHLVQNYHPSIGGTQELFRQFSERMVANFDDEVSVFTTNGMHLPSDPSGALISIPSEIINGVNVRRFPYVRRHIRPLKIMQRGTRKVSSRLTDYIDLVRMGPISPSMLYALTTSRADVVGATAAPYLHMFYPALVAKFGSRLPFVCYGALHIEQGVTEPVLRMIRATDAYVAHTTFERDFLIKNNVAPSKIHIVGAGVDLARFENGNGRVARDRYGLGDDPVVAFIGRQASHKGVDTLIHAMRSVWQRLPSARMLIAGVRTAFSATIDKLIDALPPSNRSRTLVLDSFDDDEKPDLMAACDVFTTISSAESFGIVFLEAWACSKPVLAGRIGAVRSLINEGVDGYTVEIGNAAELADGIVRLLEDDTLRAKLGANGRAKVEAHYTWDIVTAKLRAVYESVRH